MTSGLWTGPRRRRSEPSPLRPNPGELPIFFGEPSEGTRSRKTKETSGARAVSGSWESMAPVPSANTLPGHSTLTCGSIIDISVAAMLSWRAPRGLSPSALPPRAPSGSRRPATRMVPGPLYRSLSPPYVLLSPLCWQPGPGNRRETTLLVVAPARIVCPPLAPRNGASGSGEVLSRRPVF